jgi:hypothetical protein
VHKRGAGDGSRTNLRSIGTLRFSLLNPFIVPVCDCGRCGSRRVEKDGFGVDSGNVRSSCRVMVSACRILVGSAIGGKVISSWEEVKTDRGVKKNGYVPRTIAHTSSSLF